MGDSRPRILLAGGRAPVIRAAGAVGDGLMGLLLFKPELIELSVPGSGEIRGDRWALNGF